MCVLGFMYVQFYIKTFLSLTQKQKSIQKCLHVQTTANTASHKCVNHTHTHPPTHARTLPVAQKPLYVFMALLSERVCLGELLLLSRAVCVCVCVPGQQRGRDSLCHILPLEAISSHTHMFHMLRH